MLPMGLGQLQEEAPELVTEVVDDVTSTVSVVTNFVKEQFLALKADLWSITGAVDLGVIFAALALGWLLARPGRRLIEHFWPKREAGAGEHARQLVLRLVFPILWLGGLWTANAVQAQFEMPAKLSLTVASLLNAWIVIQIVVSVVRDRSLAALLATIAWFAAALNILGLLNPALNMLDDAALSFGESRLSLLMVLKGVLLAGFFLWIASALSGFIKTRLQKSDRLTPSVQTLMAQGARIGLLFAAVMLAMNAIGIDLTALAVFSGAIGVGIGFGLQSIFSNLMAGIILLLEKSVKVGDFIEFDNGLRGKVREINVRATLVTTNDNVDILVPNEEFIRTRVTNWTLREGYRRVRIPFGVAYGTDKELVKKAALEAAEAVPHRLTGPHAKEPEVWLMNFGASSLDFELVIWLRPESVKRPSRVIADYNWALEDALTKYGIEIPFPQRDLHVRTMVGDRLSDSGSEQD
ncbi:MAG: mechanosensitive ion channel domain-containing protein [Pseudomonadota bacterium]